MKTRVKYAKTKTTYERKKTIWFSICRNGGCSNYWFSALYKFLVKANLFFYFSGQVISKPLILFRISI